ncbi:hypothetical protein J8805_14660, partial [Klebsiella pneumoniae]
RSLVKGSWARPDGQDRVAHGVLDGCQAGGEALSCADTYVRHKPRHSVGAAAAVGVVIGVLLNLRR